MQALKFSKMHGLGNDFMVVDATQQAFQLSNTQIKSLAKRHTGIGFDQLLVVAPADSKSVDFTYRIFNSDGGEVEHCGNGARCFAKFVIAKGLTHKKNLKVKIKKGIININYISDNEICVDMGAPFTLPAEVPFISKDNIYQNTYNITLDNQTLSLSVISMGNPHAVIFVDDLLSRDIEPLAIAIQNSAFFPESVNVNYVQISNNKAIQLRTYERGSGETQACGSGACASAYCAYQLGLIDDKSTVTMPGGKVDIHINNNEVYMTGPAALVYDGEVFLT